VVQGSGESLVLHDDHLFSMRDKPSWHRVRSRDSESDVDRTFTHVRDLDAMEAGRTPDEVVLCGSGASDRGVVELLESATGAVRWSSPTDEACSAVRVSGSGRLVAYGTGTGQVEVMSLDRRRIFRSSPAPADVDDLVFSIDGGSLHVAHADGVVRTWDLVEGSLASHRVLAESRPWDGWQMVATPGGSGVAFVDAERPEWTDATAGPTTSCAVDGLPLATASTTDGGTRLARAEAGGAVVLYDTTTCSELVTLLPVGTEGNITSLPSGEYRASPDALDHLSVRVGSSVAGARQLHDALHRPDKIAAVLNRADPDRLATLAQAWHTESAPLDALAIDPIRLDTQTPAVSSTA
jgi:WD40 repeat protein